ncbi:MAG: SDR family NAD(P)-dependent oxidoreductase [Alphaproteobacteria bacterium]|nr:SDR family NAD(P)-dependent oxidoreductase [Alphaproteobacteria bacterium]MDX5415246.1 SDR family NAD(P)-dependent oxidoreductase [Alphaproteobacteria bacterium]MDX5492455.1 SDR family NAD(P)-dependent oxidoreductase [Alphaproteobacteria bacterium]
MKALITGASGGIGAAITRALDRRGYDLVLVDRDMAALEIIAATASRPTERIACDLASREDVERLCGAIVRDHADLDILVNNAGIVCPGAVTDIPQTDIDLQLEVNMRAPIRLMHAVAPLMVARGRGAMVTTVSLGGIIALKESAAYAASKFGLRGFLSSFHQELAPQGIRVSGIYPAAVDTPMLHYEATHGGSVLNFIDKVVSAEDVARALLKGIDTGKLEVYVPYSASLTSRFFAAFPWMIRPVLPVMEKLGEAGRKKFLARKGLSAG